jgi:predicted NodU family carbamoyl transferase
MFHGEHLAVHDAVEVGAGSVRNVNRSPTTGAKSLGISHALYTGSTESGPIALGNRSVLALPRNSEVRARRVSEESEHASPLHPVLTAVAERAKVPVRRFLTETAVDVVYRGERLVRP